MKTLTYNWELGSEEVTLRIDSYANNGRLYVGLITDKGESFANLTVNLDGGLLKANEAYINHDLGEKAIDFIEENGLGELAPGAGFSGYCRYYVVAFDMERLKEFDPEGVERYLGGDFE